MEEKSDQENLEKKVERITTKGIVKEIGKRIAGGVYCFGMGALATGIAYYTLDHRTHEEIYEFLGPKGVGILGDNGFKSFLSFMVMGPLFVIGMYSVPIALGGVILGLKYMVTGKITFEKEDPERIYYP